MPEKERERPGKSENWRDEKKGLCVPAPEVLNRLSIDTYTALVLSIE